MNSDRTTHDRVPSTAGPTSLPALLSIFTLIMWIACLVVGVLGLRLPYPSPRSPEAPPIETQMVKVELVKQPPKPEVLPPPMPDASPAPELTEPIPAVPQLPPLPAAPPVISVAAPSSAIAFPVPTQGLMRIVSPDEATHGASGNGSAAAGTGEHKPASVSVPTKPAPLVAHLTFGVGEGRQPAPEYPRDAALAGEEGTVTLRFSVDETGRVTSASVITPARWPLLNQAALRAVHDTWRFDPGAPRTYEVPIQFQLNR